MKPGECCRWFRCLAGPHHWCVHRAQILHIPVLGVNLHPGEEWTTLDDWATGVIRWAVASEKPPILKPSRFGRVLAKWMTKIGINNPVEVVSRTSVATAQASVLFVNSVETCHFCKKPGRNASNPFLKLSEMSATNLYLELLRKCCNSPGPFFTPGPRKLKIVRIHPIHPRVATIGCPFF